MLMEASYPSVEHEQASEAIVDFFSHQPDVEAVILNGSCAHGGATRDSCLDIIVMIPQEVFSTEKAKFEQLWSNFYEAEGVFKALLKVGKYSHVDMEFTDGCFMPQPRGWTGGPDEFELEIGNTLVYSVPLWNRGDRLDRLKTQWLPYYGEPLRRDRLRMARKYCLNNLNHISPYVDRGLHFQAFNRLYDAFREFLQAFFISRCVYPIAYDKWIRKQAKEILRDPELYKRLRSIFELGHFEGEKILQKANELGDLLKKYAPEV